MMTVLNLVFRFVTPILGLQTDMMIAAKGAFVQTPPIGGGLRLFGRRVRPSVVFELLD
jgi:hypothetical protein